MGSKEHIRAKLLRRRRALTPSEHEGRSRAVGLLALRLSALRSARSVALYRDMRNEVATGFLFDRLRRRRKRVSLPKVSGRRLAFYRVDRWDNLRPGYEGIPEPVARAGRRNRLDAIDFFFVPGVAFDRRGNRLGHGGGFYDRILGRRRPSSVACGLCFDFQLLNELPRQAHDRPVDVIVTEKEVIHTHA
ncbi:MAG: 5-formyltetrahydrofolate cyclo-ligase [Nitrospirae bacterium]|nr:5-formyltetrahydrofolate cyclo-ligase [Nitrospirota bacterium]